MNPYKVISHLDNQPVFHVTEIVQEGVGKTKVLHRNMLYPLQSADGRKDEEAPCLVRNISVTQRECVLKRCNLLMEQHFNSC